MPRLLRWQCVRAVALALLDLVTKAYSVRRSTRADELAPGSVGRLPLGSFQLKGVTAPAAMNWLTISATVLLGYEDNGGGAMWTPSVARRSTRSSPRRLPARPAMEAHVTLGLL